MFEQFAEKHVWNIHNRINENTFEDYKYLLEDLIFTDLSISKIADDNNVYQSPTYQKSRLIYKYFDVKDRDELRQKYYDYVGGVKVG